MIYLESIKFDQKYVLWYVILQPNRTKSFKLSLTVLRLRNVCKNAKYVKTTYQFDCKS